MRIHQGDSLEIYTANERELVLKKYSPIEDFARTATQFAEAAYKVYGFAMIVMSKDTAVACAGIQKKDVIQQKISKKIESLINAGQPYIWRSNEKKILIVDTCDKYFVKAITPIFSYGDPIGAVAAIGINSASSESTESEIKTIQTAAAFFGKQADDQD
jgi:AbrB family transcriptional regulator (stage V sporulation protein T)